MEHDSEIVKENSRFIVSRKKLSNGSYVYYRLDKENEEEGYVKTYTISRTQIKYPYSGEQIKEIILLDYKELPKFVSDIGYGFSNKSINNFFRFKITGSIKKLIISPSLPSKENKGKFTINEKDLLSLTSSINQEQRACEDTKKALIASFLNKYFPSLGFKHRQTNNNKDLILRNLNQKLIEQLTADDIERVGRFYIDATKKYKRNDLVRRMLLDLQKNSQLMTLQDVIRRYESLLEEDPLEKEWQKFFDENITLFDNRYIKRLEKKNIALGITKYPDLVLVDIYGYIDFYELKRKKTRLLQYDESHKNYYWSADISKTIAQAADYLQKARENSQSFSKAIKNETSTDSGEGLEVNIVNPRAIIVAGSSEDLENDKMKDQFKNLRESLKDIEFLLYDELLERLKNLLRNVNVK